ncbi:MAG: type II secretion system protein [bacterium]
MLAPNKFRGFTLIELMVERQPSKLNVAGSSPVVVISIVALLMALLMPALRKARETATDVACGSAMWQALIATATYNADHPEGLQNYKPDCPWWGQGWPQAHKDYDDPDTGGIQDHLWYEARSQRSYWRGYLLYGDYVSSYEALGCSAKDYPPTVNTLWSAYAGGGWNHIEGRRDETMRKAPAFVWYGPAVLGTGHVHIYAGGNIGIPKWGKYPSYHSWENAEYGVSHDGKRGPLMACGQTRVDYQEYEIPHRPGWSGEKLANPANNTPSHAGHATRRNVGFNDGSIEFHALPRGGRYNPLEE